VPLAVALGFAGCLIFAGPARALGSDNFAVPPSARQLIVVSSRGYDPPGYLATFRTFQRANASSPWKPALATWKAEIGSGDFVNVRHFGDHATPTGTFTIGLRMYGNDPNPRRLHYAYHQLVCGDWWDEDPYSPQYNQFVHVPCGTTPSFAAWSEALWTETRAYPYLAVLNTNNSPTIGGPDAPGAGIFLHHWMNAPTEGCVALPLADLLAVLRWLRPDEHPVIALGVDRELRDVLSRASATHHREHSLRAATPRRRRARANRRNARSTVAARRVATRRHATESDSALGFGAPLVAACALIAVCAVITLLARRSRRSTAV
jgi:L,D-peptidoglycan transpeptidase YkuD (ErfK/YbiS/YcfS/YnhG family)